MTTLLHHAIMGDTSANQVLSTRVCRPFVGDQFAHSFHRGRLNKAFGAFLVSEQRLYFASKHVVVPAGAFEEFHTLAPLQLQGTVTQLLDSTPKFGLHVSSPCSTPAGAKSLPGASRALPFQLKLLIPRRFLLCSGRQKISVPQLCSSFRRPRPMPSMHHRGLPGSYRALGKPTAHHPGICEAHHRLSSGNRASGQNQSESAASTVQTLQKN